MDWVYLQHLWKQFRTHRIPEKYMAHIEKEGKKKEMVAFFIMCHVFFTVLWKVLEMYSVHSDHWNHRLDKNENTWVCGVVIWQRWFARKWSCAICAPNISYSPSLSPTWMIPCSSSRHQVLSLLHFYTLGCRHHDTIRRLLCRLINKYQKRTIQ